MEKSSKAYKEILKCLVQTTDEDATPRKLFCQILKWQNLCYNLEPSDSFSWKSALELKVSFALQLTAKPTDDFHYVSWKYNFQSKFTFPFHP